MADVPPAGSFEYLKTQAVSRLYLDNIPNIQSSWVTQGLKIGQLALTFDANDMGSLMIEENVVAEAGTVHFLTLDQIRAAIEELDFIPRQRNVFYDLIDPAQEAFAIAANQARATELQSHRANAAAANIATSKAHPNGSSATPQLVPLSIVSGDGTA
jgi:cyclic dehypoxanthinyl futalosine synthase